MSQQAFAKSFYQQAQNALKEGQPEKARDLLKQAITRANLFPQAWHLMADTYVFEGSSTEAIKILKEAQIILQEDPLAVSGLQIHMASLYLKLGEPGKARAAIDLQSLKALGNWQMLSRAGYIFMLCEEHILALSALTSALDINDQDPELIFNTATANRSMGKLQQAEELYDLAIATSERNYPAYKLRSDLRKQTTEKNHIDELTKKLESNDIREEAKVHIYYSLAKELEDLERYSESFSALSKGAALRRKNLKYNLKADLELLNKITAHYGEGTLNKENINYKLGSKIIFIVGMPRTGSTLVDRMLASKESIKSAGEPYTFARLFYAAAAKSAGKRLDQNFNAAELIEASKNIDFKKLGEEYEQNILSRAKLKDVTYIIDKNPINFMFIGAIRLALPKAKVIHIARDPMDTCYAIYKTLFKEAHPYSYNILELGHYYIAYRKLMQHWSKVLPGSYYEVTYEDLVNDQIAEGKKLFHYCHLEWQKEQLEFHKNITSGTSTASAAQVRQPIYNSSVGKWKNYRKQLSALEEIINKI